MKKIQENQKLELLKLNEKLNQIHSNIDNLIIKINVLIEIFNFKKIYNNLNSAEILNINNINKNNLNINNSFLEEISNLSLIEFYDLLEEKKTNENNINLENYIFNLIPYVYNINNDSNKNIFNNNNLITSLSLNTKNNDLTINLNKENKIKIEETMKTILDKYTLNSSNE